MAELALSSKLAARKRRNSCCLFSWSCRGYRLEAAGVAIWALAEENQVLHGSSGWRETATGDCWVPLGKLSSGDLGAEWSWEAQRLCWQEGVPSPLPCGVGSAPVSQACCPKTPEFTSSLIFLVFPFQGEVPTFCLVRAVRS